VWGGKSDSESEGERERRVRRKEWGVFDKECVVGDGYIAKYLVRKFTKIPPT
jgi:hypothetical protein